MDNLDIPPAPSIAVSDRAKGLEDDLLFHYYTGSTWKQIAQRFGLDPNEVKDAIRAADPLKHIELWKKAQGFPDAARAHVKSMTLEIVERQIALALSDDKEIPEATKELARQFLLRIAGVQPEPKSLAQTTNVVNVGIMTQEDINKAEKDWREAQEAELVDEHALPGARIRG